jgi:hypothetical protein
MDTLARIRERVFEGAVPLRIAVAGSPICVNLPRNLNLGQFAYRNLANFLPPDTASLWFSVAGRPVGWHLPAGVLYSAYGPPFPTEALEIAANFDDFPKGKVLRCDSRATVSAFFCHSFKEAVFAASGALDFVQENAQIEQAVEESVLERDLAAFTRLTAPWLGGAAAWAIWPIRVFSKAHDRLVFSGVPKEEGATVGSAVTRVSIECPPDVDIQGIRISRDAAIAEIFPLLVGPDGFLYIVP